MYFMPFYKSWLGSKAFNMVNNSQYDGYHRGLASIVYKFFDQKSKAKLAHTAIKSNVKTNQQLADDQQLAFEKFKNINNLLIWYNRYIKGIYLLNRYIKGITFWVLMMLSAHAQIIHLKDNNDEMVTNAFQKIFEESGHKPNKI